MRRKLILIMRSRLGTRNVIIHCIEYCLLNYTTTIRKFRYALRITYIAKTTTKKWEFIDVKVLPMSSFLVPCFTHLFRSA